MEKKDEGNRSSWHQYLPIIFISPFAAPNHFKWQEFTLSVSLKVFIRQRYKPDTPEVVMEVKRHFLVGPKLVQRRCHSLLEGSHLFSDVTQIELCELPVLLLVINHRAMSSQKELVGRPAFDHSSQMRPIFHLSLELIQQSKGGTAGAQW